MTIRSKVFPKVLDKINGPLGNDMPSGTKAYYGFDSSDKSFALLERYNRESELLTLNSTNTSDLVNTGLDVASTDDCTISTYIVKGPLIDSPETATVACKIGFRNAFGFIKGINIGAKKMTFAADGGEPSGKYNFRLDANYAGIIVIKGSYRVLMTSVDDTSTFSFVGLDGITDAEITANFNSDNEITLDASRSLFAPSNVSGWISERSSVGDTGLSDNAVQWSATSFKQTIPFIFDSGATDGRIAASGTDLDLHYDDANTRYELITALGTVVSNNISPSSGDKITIDINVDSSDGATLTVNGSAGTTNATVTSIPVGSSTMRLMNNLAGTAATESVVISLSRVQF